MEEWELKSCAGSVEDDVKHEELTMMRLADDDEVS